MLSEPETIVFDERAKRSGMSAFDSERLADSDVELRIWVRGGFSDTRGIVLRKRSGKWTSYFLPPADEHDKEQDIVDLSDRANDWDDFAVDLEENFREMNPERDVLFHDGQTVTVQFQKGSKLKIVLSSIEPCAQDHKLGKSLCSLVKEVQQKLSITLITLPKA
jgi:hypothetical protein